MRVNQPGSSPVQNGDVAGAKKSDKAAEAKGPKKGANAEGSPSTETSGSARTELSSKGKELAKAKAAADGAPDVREEKIAELKRRIEAGKYNVDAGKVADKMVDEHIKMSGIG